MLVCDRLNPAFLGPYGNTWIETSATNHLAAQSLLVEQCLTNSMDLQSIYDTYWSTSEGSLIARCAKAEVATTLLTDDHSVAAHPLAEGFDRHICLPTSEEDTSGVPAESVAETPWASIMLSLLDEIQSDDTQAGGTSPKLLWVHARGCDGKWTSPHALRESFVGEEDPPPPEFVATPCEKLGDEVDPDALLGWQQAYAAEVSALDECLSPIVDCLATPAMANTLFVLTSSRGFPLGEHAVVGSAEPVLHAEALHVPLLIRFPETSDTNFAAERVHSIWQPRDICRVISDWIHGCQIVAYEYGAERAVAGAEKSWALRTPCWFATGQLDAEATTAESTKLYAKPDDRFEANDVADICEDVAIEMRSEYTRTVDSIQAGTFAELPELSELLREAPS